MAERFFERLLVWEKAHQLTLNIYQLSKKFPKEEIYCLTNQLRRSAISIPANIAEGSKKTRKDFIRYLYISQASLEETKYYILLSIDLKYCSKEECFLIEEVANETGKMLTGLIKKLTSASYNL